MKILIRSWKKEKYHLAHPNLNTLLSSQAVILDVRSADEFSKGHIPNSIFIGIDGGFAPWVTLIGDTQHPIIW